jgi:hypothetical protein
MMNGVPGSRIFSIAEYQVYQYNACKPTPDFLEDTKTFSRISGPPTEFLYDDIANSRISGICTETLFDENYHVQTNVKPHRISV